MTNKEIKKLAQEHAKKVLGDQYLTNKQAAQAIALDYLAGFEKAKEIFHRVK